MILIISDFLQWKHLHYDGVWAMPICLVDMGDTFSTCKKAIEINDLSLGSDKITTSKASTPSQQMTQYKTLLIVPTLMTTRRKRLNKSKNPN